MLSRLAISATRSRVMASSMIANKQAVTGVVSKAYFTAKPPAKDPLALIRDECHRRKLCDEYGFRRPGVHWVFSVAVTPDDLSQVGTGVEQCFVCACA